MKKTQIFNIDWVWEEETWNEQTEEYEMVEKFSQVKVVVNDEVEVDLIEGDELNESELDKLSDHAVYLYYS